MTLPLPPERPGRRPGRELPTGEPLDAIELIREDVPPPLAREVDARTVLAEPDIDAQMPEDESSKKAMEAMYGSEFPMLKDEAESSAWGDWAKSLWDRHRGGHELRLHEVRRNRLFRAGIQWISAVGLQQWREPPKPKEAARPVANMIAPALDLRTQIVSEQRPGWQIEPVNHDSRKQRRAEARQLALEYQYDQQKMARVLKELSYWAGTDGVSFCELYWDPDKGPWEEIEVSDPSNPEGEAASKRLPMGEICPRVRRIEQVRVSSDATATQAPWYVVIRDVLPTAKAVKEYGLEGNRPVGAAFDTTDVAPFYGVRHGLLVPSYDELFRDQTLSERFTVYCAKSEFLPNGLQIVVVDGEVEFLGPLLFGVIPVARYADGSFDPAYFPTPEVNKWIDPQMRVNAILAKWVENLRYNAHTRLLMRENAVSGETLVGGIGSAIAVKGLGALNDIVRPIEGFSLSNDAKELLDREVRNFENLTGWNDVTRGQFSSDQSGRAILAIREQLERVFAPSVGAAADFMADWAKITLAIMRWGYDVPRMVGITGQNRADLAVYVSSEDFDGVADVRVDPETMIPMPRSLRLFLIKDMVQMGMMDLKEARRRMPFGYLGSINAPDEDQEARAKRCAEALRQGQMLEILWQDNEAIHQDVLERELILPDDTPPPVRQLAQQRWMMLAQQAMMKTGGMPPAPTGPPSKGGEGASLPATSAPLPGQNSSLPAAPQGLATDEVKAARQFEQMTGVS